jgi:hypothetical protein
VECGEYVVGARQQPLHSLHLVPVGQFIVAPSGHVRPKQRAEVMKAAMVKMK